MSAQILTPTQQDFVMIQITDTHLMEHPDASFVGMYPEQSFHKVLDLAKQKHPKIDLIIHTGDLAQSPKPTTYQRYIDYMQTLHIPFFQTLGNHDEVAYFPFTEKKTESPTVIECGKWCIILLNSAQPQRVDGNISTDQLQQLTQLLQQYHDRYIIIAFHHHPFMMQSAWIDQHRLKNAAEFLETIQPFCQTIKAVICGHVHQDSLHIWKGIQFLSTPSTCVQFKPLNAEFALDRTQHPGYRYFCLKANGEFETQVHRIVTSQYIDTDLETSGYD